MSNTCEKCGMRERYQEYLRRNLLVAKAAGAKVDVSMVLARLESQSRPPQWLVNDLRRILERVDPLPGELARWRDTAPDTPAPERTGYERMFHSAVAALAEISDALGIPEDVASTANGNAEILHAIRALMDERDALAAKVASYERAERDGLEAVRTTDATLNAGLDKLRAIANGDSQ